MGAFYQRIAIAATAAGPFEELEALVDTKTTYTQVPGSILEGLGIQPTLRGQFETDDGRTIQRGLAEVTMRLGIRFTRPWWLSEIRTAFRCWEW